MRLLLDANLPRSLADRLRQVGYDAVHVRDLARADTKDEQIVVLARERQQVVVTQDHDFIKLVARAEAHMVSLILLRLHRPTAERLLRRITAAVMRARTDLEAGAIASVDDSQVRIKRLPIES